MILLILAEPRCILIPVVDDVTSPIYLSERLYFKYVIITVINVGRYCHNLLFSHLLPFFINQGVTVIVTDDG